MFFKIKILAFIFIIVLGSSAQIKSQDFSSFINPDSTGKFKMPAPLGNGQLGFQTPIIWPDMTSSVAPANSLKVTGLDLVAQVQNAIKQLAGSPSIPQAQIDELTNTGTTLISQIQALQLASTISVNNGTIGAQLDGLYTTINAYLAQVQSFTQAAAKTNLISQPELDSITSSGVIGYASIPTRDEMQALFSMGNPGNGDEDGNGNPNNMGNPGNGSDAQVGCGNGQQGGPGTPSGGTGSDNSGNGNPPLNNTGCGDPVNVYTANDYREAEDLVVYGGVGEQSLSFRRFTNSRFVGSAQPFGAGSSVRHNYQWDMADYTSAANGARQITLTYPNGTQNIFTQISPTQWLSTPGVSDIINQSGSDYRLQTKNGWQYHFATLPAGTSHYYRMTDFTDSKQNVYPVAYDSSNRVIQVSEPAGRFIKISYGIVNIGGQTERSLVLFTSAPAPGVPLTYVFNKPVTNRYLRYSAALKAEIAEIRFFDAQGNTVNGQIFGTPATSPDHSVAAAADGNPATYFESTEMNGYVGIDQGTSPVAVYGVTITPRAGYEANIVRSLILVDDLAPATASVITQVGGSDGRVVNYNYSQVTNMGVAFTYPVLTSVVYPDQTTAEYNYYQTIHDTRPLLSDAIDPRATHGQEQIHMNYFSGILGAVQSQFDPRAQTLLAVGLNNNNLHQPTATFPTIQGGQAVNEFDMNNGLLNVRYDAQNGPTTFTANAGGIGFVTSVKDALNHTVQINPSNFANPLAITLPDGSTRTISRDNLDLPMAVTNELSRTTTYTRDAFHRITRISYPDATSEAFSYNNFGQVTTHQLRNGTLETTIYDARGLALSHTDSTGQTVTYAYDTADRPASVTDANGNATRYVYNDRGQVTQIIYADHTTSSYVYDYMGNKTSETNELGQTRTYTYDSFKRLTSITDPLHRTTTYTFGGGYTNNPIAVTLPSGRKTTFAYDSNDRVISTTVGAGSPDAATTACAYDVVGNVVSRTDPLGHVTTYSYDSRNRKISETDALGHKTKYAYDAVGNVLSVTRADGTVTGYTYDSMNRLLITTDAKNETTTRSYNISGNLITLTDAKGNITTFAYDLKNRRVSTTYPNGSIERWTYDPVGSVATYTTRAGQVKTSIYDSRNREISYTWSDGTPGVTRVYDAAGRLVSSDNGSFVSTYTYDAAGQLLSETQANIAFAKSWPVDYVYDQDGNRTGTVYPSGQMVSYGYTGRNQVNSIEAGGTPVAAYTYALNGELTSKVLGNGTTANYAYDAADRLTSLNHAVGGASFARFDYGYDLVNRRTFEQRDNAIGDAYTYDAIDQVTGVQYDVANPNTSPAGAVRSVGYSYDSTGNRTAVTDSVNGNSSYVVNNLNQYTAVSGIAYNYDGNGNLSEGKGLYIYDAQNRLESASTGGNVITLYYDSKNRVIQRTTNGVTLCLIYDGWDLIEERDSSGNLLASYVHGVRQDELLSKTTASATVYYHQNALGSTASLTDSTGAVIERYKYDAFGKPSITDGSGHTLTASAYGNRFLYTGREWLAEIGLYDYRNRVYSADLGRFLQTDPMGFAAGDVNIYRYCGNNSLNGSDPLGLCFNGRLGGNWSANIDTGFDSSAQDPNSMNIDPSQNDPFSNDLSGIDEYFNDNQNLPDVGNLTPQDLIDIQNGNSNIDGSTLQIGITVNGQLGPVNLNLSFGVAFDLDGNVGGYDTIGVGPGAGAGVSAGLSYAVSNGNTIADLAGPFGYASSGAGAGPDASLDGFTGPGAQGQNVTGVGGTFGVGVGGGAAAGGSLTWIHPFN